MTHSWIDAQPYGAGPIHDMGARNGLIRGSAFHWDTAPARQGSRISRRRRLNRCHAHPAAAADRRQRPRRERQLKGLTQSVHRETREKNRIRRKARST
jgi:hypothetical protein